MSGTDWWNRSTGSSWWVNQIGSASEATTEPEEIPSYGLAYELGTAPWDAKTFKVWQEDEVRRRQGARIQSQAQQAEDVSLFNKLMGGARDAVMNLFGSGDFSAETDDGGFGIGLGGSVQVPDQTPQDYKASKKRGAKRVEEGVDTLMKTPVIGEAISAVDTGLQAVSTPLVLHRNTEMQWNREGRGFFDVSALSMWVDSSEWAAAWREADERSPGVALADIALMDKDTTTRKDLDRIRRTSNLHGLTALGTDLFLGFKFDPTVIAGKAVGEVRQIKRGALPRGVTSHTARAAAGRVAFGGDRYKGPNPLGHYGNWRGEGVRSRWDDVWKALDELDFADSQDLPMFRGNATNGANLHYAMMVARGNPELRDLTERAAMGNAGAWAEIRRLSETAPSELEEFLPGQGTFSDALDAGRDHFKTLQKEIDSLEARVAATGDDTARHGFFNWSLHRTLDEKYADLEELDLKLRRHEPYQAWLNKMLDNKGVSVEQVSAKVNTARPLRQETFQESPYSRAHTVSGIARATYVREANPIDLHRVDTGVMSIRRQFEQFRHLYNYVPDRDELNATLKAFVEAPNEQARRVVVQELELTHGVRAIQKAHPDLSEETIRRFLQGSRARVDDMFDRLVSGSDSVYTTLPEGKRIAVEVAEGEHKWTYDLPIDPAQLPNFYTPMDHRQVMLAVRRNKELFLNIDTATKSWARGTEGRGMELLTDGLTQFNNVWKPAQLFRLAWPQRVWLDETARAMSMVGAMAWAREFAPALLTATANAAKVPLRAGHAALGREHNVDYGTGPVSRAMSGDDVDVPNMEAELATAPVIPDYLTPRPSAKRSEILEGSLRAEADFRAASDKWVAMMREPNPRQSLPFGGVHGRTGHPMRDENPDDWLDIEEYAKYHALEDFDRPVADEEFTGEDLLWARDTQGRLGPRVVAHPTTPALERFLNKYEFDALREVLDTDASQAASVTAARRLDPSDVADYGRGGRLRNDLREHLLGVRKRRVAEEDALKTGKGAGPVFSQVHGVFDGPEMLREMLRARRLGARYVPLTRAASNSSFRRLMQAAGHGAEGRAFLSARQPRDVMQPVLETWSKKMREVAEDPDVQKSDFVLAIDPISGKEVKSGYAVPVAHIELESGPSVGRATGDLRVPQNSRYQLNKFMEEHAELLASPGYRLLVDEQLGRKPKLTVARVFRQHERNKAIALADQAHSRQFFDITNGYNRHVRSWEDESPILEQVRRRFRFEEDGPELVPGPKDAAADVGAPVFHGTGSDAELPDPLLPRKEAPVDRGLMAGDGFYTSVDLRLVTQGYATKDLNRIYTIRGTKSGKKYKIFDLEQRITPEDRAEFMEFYQRKVFDGEIRGMSGLDDDVAMMLDTNTWFDFYQSLDMNGLNRANDFTDSLNIAGVVDDFLEARYNAGVKQYPGGAVLGGPPHKVLVWMHPEDLEIAHAYQSPGTYHQVSEWFLHPDNPFNEVPQNRVHRVGPKPAQLERDREAMNERLRETEANALGEGEDFDFAEFDAEINNSHDAFARNLLRRRQYGQGKISFRNAKGELVWADNVFEGPGLNYTQAVSASPVMQRMANTYHRTLNMYRKKAVGHRKFRPPDMSPLKLKTAAGRRDAKVYLANYADLMNDQVRNSPIWFKMLEGKSNDEIIMWLRKTHEGRAVRDRVPHRGANPERWVEEHRQHLDYYLPRPELQQLLAQRRLEPSDLRAIKQDDLPTVYGPDLDLVDGTRGMGAEVTAWVDKIYNFLGTLPTDQLVRQPFAAAAYRLKMKNLIAAQDGPIDNDVLRMFEGQAREFAIRQVKRTMYDLTDDSNFTQAARFLAPFWGAQEEAMRKWGRIVVERPETLARFYVGQETIFYDNMLMIDEEGDNIVHSPDGILNYNPNHRVVMQIPKELRKMPWFKDVLRFHDSVDFALGSLNTALQGDNFLLPSVGPVVTFPADKLLRMQEDHGVSSSEDGWYRWLFPVGRPTGGFGAADAMFPGWARRASQLAQGEENLTYANTFMAIYREWAMANKEKGKRPPKMEDVARAADSLTKLRLVSSFGLPVPLNFRPKHQLFIDEYHRMQQRLGPEQAFPAFIKKYGVDMALFTASGSKSNLGIAPTVKGMEAWKANDKLMAEHQDWASLMQGPDAWADDFSSDAYRSQFELSIEPGSTEKLRSQLSPKERIHEVDLRTGWLEYRQFMSAIDAELAARGLTSLQQTEAADLKEMKDAFTSDLAKRNEAWGDDRLNFHDTSYQKIRELKQWVWKPRFDNRPDIQGVRQYLLIRNEAARSLDQYAISTGGSRSLQAEENTDLRLWFYDQVGSLIQQNPAFGEVYHRYLQSDTLERGSGP